jgi:hypothetical protein
MAIDDTIHNDVAAVVSARFNKDDYTRYGNLLGARRTYSRGDLSLYYFPAVRSDSCWSGIINKSQTTELNSSYLSYACMPLEGKLLFLYNSESRTTHAGSTTFLDTQGYALDEGLVLWRRNNRFDIQKARQIGAHELAVPYQKNRMLGFVVIRL